MKMKQKLVLGALAASLMAVGAPAAFADVSASIGAGNMYYWRGLDLGNGSASVWGDLKYSESGFYTGIWGGSGDAASGQEYDIYAGYGSTLGDFKYDLSVWTYSYPKTGVEIAPGDLTEAVAMVGYGPVAFTYYKNVSAKGPMDNSYSYATLAFTLDKFTVKVGQHMADAAPTDGMTHVDFTYAYNDKVSFTLGQVIENGEEGEVGDMDYVEGLNDETKFVVAFTLPIE